jgi:sugar lactone lactonase YvrE
LTGLAGLAGQPTRLPVPEAELGEGPCWDAADSTLYWVDIPARQVHALGADGQLRSWDAGQPVGAVALRAAGGLVLAVADGFVTLDTGTGAIAPLASVDHGLPDVRMNDGACDRAGRFYAGSMASDESPGAGALYRLDPDHSLTRLITGIGISNGISWSPDDRQMYYVDSLDYRVDVLDYDAATGEIGNRRPLVEIGGGEVMPDGLTVDADGGIWVAVWGGGAVHRYSTDGALTATVKLPAAHVTCPTFGGPDLETLYVTTAAGDGDGAGALFSFRPGVAGLPTSPYRG